MSNEFKIDKRVPMPMSATKKNRYPWTDMKVGDSFSVTGIKEFLSARQAAYLFANRHKGYKFRAHLDGDGGRIWRVK